MEEVEKNEVQQFTRFIKMMDERVKNTLAQMKIHFDIHGTRKMQVNPHQLWKQPIALASNELKINQPNEQKHKK